MTGCLPSTLFVSEVLVILSSCVFVVMALLTAVVSVTNITFTDKNDQSIDQLHCTLPNRFSVNSSFDLPSDALENAEKYKENSALPSFLSLLFSTLRANLIEKKLLKSDQYLKANATSLMMSIESSIDNNFFYYNMNNVSLFFLCCMKFFKEGKPSLKLVDRENKSYEFSFQITENSFMTDIEEIKSIISKEGKPVPLSLSFDIKKFVEGDDDFDSCFLVDSTENFLVFGWNDDLIFSKLSNQGNYQLTGGFILKNYDPDENKYGHSLPFYYGNLTVYEENGVCPNSKSKFRKIFPTVDSSGLFLDPNAKLKCIKESKCDLNSIYYLVDNNLNLCSNNSFRNNSSNFQLQFLWKNVLKFENITLNFDNCDEVFQTFELVNQNKINQCDYIFLPYKIFYEVISRTKLIEQPSFGIFSQIKWNIPESLTTSFENTYTFDSRPKLYYDI